MTRGLEIRVSRVLLALLLAAAGAAGLTALRYTELTIGGSDFTSIGLLVSGLVLYCGVLLIVSMFKTETYLSIAILLPSIVAVGIFVYGFIGWSVRVSLSKWTGLTPDFTWVGLQQYTELMSGDVRFAIDVRNTAVFTVGFITG